MAEVPTMACFTCKGNRWLAKFRGLGQDPASEQVDCPACTGTGRIPRQPLTPDEIAALPDGARVVVEWHGGTYGVATVNRDEVGIWLGAGATVDDAHRVWLADDDGDA